MTGTPKSMNLSSLELGMNTRAPDHKLRTDKGYFLRDAVNVDLSDSGTLKRRRGTTLALTGTSAHSLWADDNHAFYADGLTLYRLTDTLTGLTRAAVTTVTAGRAVTYTQAPEGGTYWSDGVRLERIVGNSSQAINPAVPALVPSITASGTGALAPGRYTVLFTAVDSLQRESAPTPSQQIFLPLGGTLAITLTDAPDLPIAVYVSAPDGDMPYFVGTLTAVGTLAVNLLPAGRACPTYGLAPTPPGRIIRHFNGRLLVAADNILFLSEPFAPGLYRPETGYIPFPETITMLEAIQGQAPGVYVAADQTDWLGGNTADSDIVNVLPYGAVEGTSQLRTDKTLCHWMSPRGLIEAGTGGGVKNLQEDTVAIAPTTSGATLVRDDNGTKQARTSLFGSPTHQLATASSYMDAEIVNGA